MLLKIEGHKFMKQLLKPIILMLISTLTYANNEFPRFALDKINFQVSARQWVTTQSALLTVSINMTLNNADLIKARADIMSNLNKIAAGDWHLLTFDRSQDSSGLEKLYVEGQARVNQKDLVDIYQNAKKSSTPGAQYGILNVEFKPSLEETQMIRDDVRTKLYQKVNDELAKINKAYPQQNYSINHLLFVEGSEVSRQPMPQSKAINAMVLDGAAAPSLSVSNELVLTAMVEVASNRKLGG